LLRFSAGDPREDVGVEGNIEGAADEGLLEAVRTALVMAAEPEKAPTMQSYMKSAMPYLGVPKPARERALRPLLAARVLPDAAVWSATVPALWRRDRSARSGTPRST
jgi:hypothetical protein